MFTPNQWRRTDWRGGWRFTTRRVGVSPPQMLGSNSLICTHEIKMDALLRKIGNALSGDRLLAFPRD